MLFRYYNVLTESHSNTEKTLKMGHHFVASTQPYVLSDRIIFSPFSVAFYSGSIRLCPTHVRYIHIREGTEKFPELLKKII
jgi:hypothetical protein